MKLDKKNCQILNFLEEDCRMTYTHIAKKVGLSVDSVRKRIKKLKHEKIFFPKIQLRPRHFGFPNIVIINIKLQNYNSTTLNEFIAYLREHPLVTEIYSISGEWDFQITMLVEDNYFNKPPSNAGLPLTSDQIRNKYGNLIKDWSESLTKVVYKFENYDMVKLMGH